MQLRDMFKGPSGGYDVVRILFGAGGVNGLVAPVVFQGWAMIKGQPLDIAAFCIGYGGMIGAIVTAGGVAMSLKDKGVASALNTTPAPPIGGGQP